VPNTAINGIPSPDSSSPNNPPIHFDAANAVVDTRLNSRHPTTTDRDSRITTPVNGMRTWVDSPAGWYDRVGGAWRYTPAVIPTIAGGLQRTDGSAVVNIGGASGATADTALQVTIGSSEGTWTTVTSGLGVGRACSTPGWYDVRGQILTNVAAPRYEDLRITGTVASVLGTANGGSATAPPGGFGGASGSVRIKAPSGISVIFTYQQNGAVGGTIRASAFSITWVGPITS
jgi:hypothetical protein